MKSMPETVLADSGKDEALAVGSQQAGTGMLKDELGEHIDMNDALAGPEERLRLVGHYRAVVERCRQQMVGGELTAS